MKSCALCEPVSGSDEVVVPDVIWALRSESTTGPPHFSQSRSRELCLAGILSPLEGPDPLHAILAHRPTLLLEQGSEPAVDIATILSC